MHSNNNPACFRRTRMLLLAAEPLSAQSEWDISTEKYGGNEYIIKKTEIIYTVTNKKYDWLKEATREIKFEGETEKEFDTRRNPVCEKIYNVANNIFNFSDIPVSRDELYELTLVCYFNSVTKNYAGCYFFYDTEVKNYFTLAKLNQLENNLLKANINAGKTNLLNPNGKYFTISVSIRVGK